MMYAFLQSTPFSDDYSIRFISLTNNYWPSNKPSINYVYVKSL